MEKFIAGEQNTPLGQIFTTLVRLRASDLHLISNSKPKIRVDGDLLDLPDSSVWSSDDIEKAVYNLISPAMRERFEKDLELDFSVGFTDLLRFRVNLYYQKGMLAAAIRVISGEILSLEQLGIPPKIADFTRLPRGLVLVTGPTGSGKSTTLASMIDLINRTRDNHIITVEDPIEFIHVNNKSVVEQREIGLDTHSFADALKHVLRQDPDVILIGEMRDHETISSALTAAETGHLVLATLHTQDAPQTIDRIVDVFPPDQQDQVRIQLSLTLKGIVSQVLLPHISGKGRVVATEVLVVTPAVANLIRENKAFQIPSILMASGQDGMHSFDQSLAYLVESRQVSLDSAFERAHDQQGFMALVGSENGFQGRQSAYRPDAQSGKAVSGGN
jgi:twitching motility protein PilT